jgi:hypothetical protein
MSSKGHRTAISCASRQYAGNGSLVMPGSIVSTIIKTCIKVKNSIKLTVKESLCKYQYEPDSASIAAFPLSCTGRENTYINQENMK